MTIQNEIDEAAATVWEIARSLGTPNPQGTALNAQRAIGILRRTISHCARAFSMDYFVAAEIQKSLGLAEKLKAANAELKTLRPKPSKSLSNRQAPIEVPAEQFEQGEVDEQL